jgi:aerobic-type carbon monoxide dehydrogenase small subunit (CoxS/CutS family)
MPLLYILRNDLGLHGPRFGCGLGQCGACTVHVDGRSARSCVTPLSAVMNAKIVTLEGRVSVRMCKQVSVSLPKMGDSHDDQFDDYTGVA